MLVCKAPDRPVRNRRRRFSQGRTHRGDRDADARTFCQSSVSGSFSAFLANEELCDCLLVVDGVQFHAHRVVLAASSAYLRGLFASGMREASEAAVTLHDFSAAVFRVLLGFMYAGTWG